MINIFHGDNQTASRNAFNQLLDQHQKSEILRLDSKNLDLDMVNGFINSQSLFGSSKVLAITNFFSINKATLNKVLKIIKDSKSLELLIWQNKTITPTQAKTFPGSRISNFPVNKILFSCLSQIRSKNLTKFMPLFKKIIKKEPFELFLYLIKNNLRRQLTSYSTFNKDQLKKTYLQLIEIDFQNKTGQLSIPKEFALEQVIFNLLK